MHYRFGTNRPAVGMKGIILAHYGTEEAYVHFKMKNNKTMVVSVSHIVDITYEEN